MGMIQVLILMGMVQVLILMGMVQVHILMGMVQVHILMGMVQVHMYRYQKAVERLWVFTPSQQFLWCVEMRSQLHNWFM